MYSQNRTSATFTSKTTITSPSDRMKQLFIRCFPTLERCYLLSTLGLLVLMCLCLLPIFFKTIAQFTVITSSLPPEPTSIVIKLLNLHLNLVMGEYWSLSTILRKIYYYCLLIYHCFFKNFLMLFSSR